MNAKRRVFEDFAGDYDHWFDDHAKVYNAQLRLLGRALPSTGHGLEIGVGSGRFAAPLGIRCGTDPSFPLAEMAKRRGVEVTIGTGEHLPYRSGSFDYVVMMTVICFLDDMAKVFREGFRVLVPSGIIMLGFIVRDGEIFRHYSAEPEKGRFLRHARFHSSEEVIQKIHEAGFSGVEVTTREHGFCILTGKKEDFPRPMSTNSF
ncbi:MAG: class I SAM-dependent methyltransferase [Methanomicrobiales archaeon]|nr:class I SAM-dependent methyltransferase [Methanomicrobiales archaeon]